jgi:hypothetical protein
MARHSNEPTRREWRELGFFYELDDPHKRWRLVGSRAGLGRFAELLHSYAGDPENGRVSHRQSYGPYLYLRIATAAQRGIDGRSFHGSLQDLVQLAAIVEKTLASCAPGYSYEIHRMYAPDAAYSLILEVMADGFDPASADRMLPREQ